MRMAGGLSVTLMMAMMGGAIGIAQSDPAQAQIRARIQAYDTAIKPELFTQDAVFWTGAYAHPHRMNEPQAQVEVDNITAPGRKNSKNVTTVDRITVNGDMAFEYSTFVLTYDDNEGHHTRNGAVLRTWQRQGGVWKIAAQIQRPFGRVEFVDEQPKK